MATAPTSGSFMIGADSSVKGGISATPPAPTPPPPTAPPPSQNGGTTSPSGGTPSPYYSRVSPDTQLDNPAPQSEDQIQASKLSAAQGEINGLNSYYADLTKDQQVINDKNDRSTAAVNTLTGLAGSSEADVQQKKTTTDNTQALKKITDEAAMKVQGILSQIRTDSATEARQQRLDYNSNITTQATLDEAKTKQAVSHITNLTAAGVTADGLKNTDPTSYAHLLSAYGGDEAALKGAFALNTPKDQILTSSVVNGSLVIARQNPITQAITHETVDLGLPKGSVQVADAGGYLLFGKAGADGKWDGDMSTTTKINKTLTPDQVVKNGPGVPGATDLSSLPANAQATLKTNGFTAYNADTQGLASQLVEGRLAPSDLSKRTTGSSSYNQILTAADKYSMATTGKHFDIAKANIQYKYAINPGTQSTLKYLGSLVGSDDGSGNPSGGNLDSLVTLSKSVAAPKGVFGGQTSFPALNNADQWAKLQTGDPQIAAYYTTMLEVSDQIAKVLQGGGTGSGTSDAKLAQAQGLFQKGFTKDQVAAVAGSLKTLLASRANSMVKDNPYLSDFATQFGVKQDSSGSNTSGPAAGTDGTTFGFPGYHSDGTQWVPN